MTKPNLKSRITAAILEGHKPASIAVGLNIDPGYVYAIRKAMGLGVGRGKRCGVAGAYGRPIGATAEDLRFWRRAGSGWDEQLAILRLHHPGGYQNGPVETGGGRVLWPEFFGGSLSGCAAAMCAGSAGGYRSHGGGRARA